MWRILYQRREAPQLTRRWSASRQPARGGAQSRIEAREDHVVAALEAAEHLGKTGQVDAVVAAELVAFREVASFAADGVGHGNREETTPVRLELLLRRRKLGGGQV